MLTFKTLADFLGQDGIFHQNGSVVCYKCVTHNLHDWWTGRVDNSPGATPPIIEEADPNCVPGLGGAGYHFAGWAKAHEYGGSRRMFVLCEVRVSDVVAVTQDGVLRARAYRVLQVVKQPLTDTAPRRPTMDPFAEALPQLPSPREVVAAPPPGPQFPVAGTQPKRTRLAVKVVERPATCQAVSSALDGPLIPVHTGHPFDDLSDAELEQATVAELRKYAVRLGVIGAGKLRRLPQADRPGLLETIYCARYGGR